MEKEEDYKYIYIHGYYTLDHQLNGRVILII